MTGLNRPVCAHNRSPCSPTTPPSAAADQGSPFTCSLMFSAAQPAYPSLNLSTGSNALGSLMPSGLSHCVLAALALSTTIDSPTQCAVFSNWVLRQSSYHILCALSLACNMNRGWSFKLTHSTFMRYLLSSRLVRLSWLA